MRSQSSFHLHFSAGQGCWVLCRNSSYHLIFLYLRMLSSTPWPVFKIESVFFIFFLLSCCVCAVVFMAGKRLPLWIACLHLTDSFLCYVEDFQHHEIHMLVIGYISWVIRVLFRKPLPIPIYWHVLSTFLSRSFSFVEVLNTLEFIFFGAVSFHIN